MRKMSQIKKSHNQLYNEIYSVVKNTDRVVMFRLMYDLFKKRNLDRLDNDQLEILLTKLKDHYGIKNDNS